jgi:hypothetical protein
MADEAQEKRRKADLRARKASEAANRFMPDEQQRHIVSMLAGFDMGIVRESMCPASREWTAVAARPL